MRDLYATPRHSAPQMRFYMKSQRAHGRRDRIVLAVCPSREINRFTRGNGNGTVVRTAGYDGYDLRGFARHTGERAASLHVVSRTQSRQTYLNAHTSARVCGDLARVYMYTRILIRA